MVTETKGLARGLELGAAEEKLCGSSRPIEAALDNKERSKARPTPHESNAVPVGGYEAQGP